MHIGQLTPEPGERHGVFGGSRAGKSAFMEWVMREIQETRPYCMQLLFDTKPRFRAEMERGNFRRGRKSAAYRYETWTKGPMVPNSLVCDIWDERPFHDCWREPGEIVIMQGADVADWIRMLELAKAFVNAQIKGRERRMIVDEALDFYGRNTWGIDSKNDIFYRTARAGGERAIGIELGAHRIHGLPPLILNQLSRATLFHLVDDGDMIHLRKSVGIKDAESPKGNWVFRQWTREPGGTVSDPVTGRASYPESYLSQLAPT